MQQQAPNSPKSAPPRRKYKYTPWSVVSGPLALPLGLTFGKTLGEVLEWEKLATVAAECGVGAVVALVLALAINFLFGKEVEIREWKQPSRPAIPGYGTARLALRAGIVAALLAVATFMGLTIRDRVEEKQKANHAAGLVQAVLNVDIAQVPAIVSQMTEYRQWTDPLLREENSKEADNSRQKLHTSLALLPVDASQVKYLKGRLLDAEAGEVAVIRDALLPHKYQLVGELWPVVESPERGNEGQRLRAAAALAKYDPESDKWANFSALIAHDLVQQNPIYLLYWSEAFRPVRGAFLPPLSESYRDRRPEGAAERSLATYLLADYAADNSQVLADLLMDADEKQFAVIYPKLKEGGGEASLLLMAEIDKKLPADLPSSDERRENLAKRQVNAAVALLRMDQAANVWALLKHRPDPRVRSYLIHRLSPLGADAGAIVKQLDMESDVTIRQAVVLSLGEYGETGFTPDARNALLPTLQTLYQTASDPGLHAACEWLLRRWKKEAWLTKLNEAWAKDKEQREKRLEGIEKALAKDKEKTPPQWYVNTQGQTMLVIPGPVEFVMGSPLTEKGRRRNDEFQHRKRIVRTFVLAAVPVTKDQFLRFQPSFSHDEFGRYPYPTCPIGGVTWYQAAAYCNWLSQQEGIPEDQWCYEIPKEPGGMMTWKFTNMKLKPNCLSLAGYRLPTEAEWEYACRAGAVTSRCYGETAKLQTKYGWNWDNTPEHTQPVGTLKPNEWGLFDMQGNVASWCQDRHKPYPANAARPIDDVEDILDVVSTDKRVLRGGSFLYAAGTVRSADRIGPQPPSYWSFTVGFRPARTFAP